MTNKEGEKRHISELNAKRICMYKRIYIYKVYLNSKISFSRLRYILIQSWDINSISKFYFNPEIVIRSQDFNKLSKY